MPPTILLITGKYNFSATGNKSGKLVVEMVDYAEEVKDKLEYRLPVAS